MKIVKKILNITTMFLLQMMFFPIVANANIVCNDGTISPSCGDCHRGCCSHHGGCSNRTSNNSASSGGNTNNNISSKSNYKSQQPIGKEEIKSNDVSLKAVTINYEDIDISNNMSYSTTEESVNIYAVANDDKATIEYNSKIELSIGDNIVKIIVKAENGDVKEYKLNVIREKILSNNKNIKVIIDDKEVVFNLFKSETIYLSSDKNKLDIKYELEDRNAKVEVIGNENLKVGQNEVVVKVTAENGEEQDYTIMVEKYAKKEEIIINIVSIIITIGFFCGIGYLIYWFIKKKK